MQGVHQMFEGSPDRKWREDEPRTNKLVFIGRDLDPELLKQGFEDCLWERRQAEIMAATNANAAKGDSKAANGSSGSGAAANGDVAAQAGAAGAEAREVEHANG